MATDLLPFQRTIIEQVLEDDCLCVLAPGLGLHQIVAVLLRLQDVRLQSPDQRGSVLIVGASAWQRTALRHELARIHPEKDRIRPSTLRPTDLLPPIPAEVTADIATAERLRLYNSCSCMFVTTRILVVDLLSGRLSPSDIAGIYVLNAHRVTDSSGEGFVVRLYRTGNTTGFVRGFSDAPSSFTSEFGKTEKVMKALYAKRLHLWPRFQVAVQEDLEARPPELVEVSLPCDPGAALVYEALAELVDGCIKELRKLERLDTTDLTPSQGLSSSFDETIRRQLAPIWHTVSPKTRQIVADLRTLRTLAGLLNKLDPITFLNYLDTLRVTEGTRCAWLFHSAAHTVFEAAKARVYSLSSSQAGSSAQTKKRKAPPSGESRNPVAISGGASGASAGVRDGATVTSRAGAVPVLDPVLDELPKWHALLEIIEEARQERNEILKKLAAAAAAAAATEEEGKEEETTIIKTATTSSNPATDNTTALLPPTTNNKGTINDQLQASKVPPPLKPAPPTPPPPPPPILVFCQDEYTCTQLREVVGPDGPSGLMRRVYREYLQYKIDSGVNVGRKKGTNDNNMSGNGGAGRSGGNNHVTTGIPRLMGGYLPGEEEALAKEARGMGATRNKSNLASGGRGGGQVQQGRRGGGGRGTSSKAALAAATSALAGNSARVIIDDDDDNNDNELDPSDGTAAVQKKKKNLNNNKTKSIKTAAAPTSAAAVGDVEDVIFVALDSTGPLPLWEYSPTHVVVYDPDVALTRSLEVFKAQRRSHPLRVYLLRYEDSPEMDKYQAAVVRERSAFESLIRGKGIMAPVMNSTTIPGSALINNNNDNNSNTGGASGSIVPGLQAGAAGNALTRRAGGRLGGRPERIKVIVDVREFMSPLPAVLHSKGLQVIPLTLEVGDYVLSPEVCVERKSLTDLRGSLISGRLYQQAEAMCRHYRTAVLLIEFEGDRAFALQGAGELGDDIQSNAMMSRLVLLCLHHPRLRLVWSRSLHATADMFKQMKANHEEPDAVAAATVGVAGDEGGGGTGVESVVNSTAIDLLKRLPGVTDSNYRALMREAGSLAGLATMSLQQLTGIMGGEVPARKLREFLAQECRALFRAL